MQRITLLEYRNYRYLKASAILMVLAVVAYVLHHPVLGPYGGTWLGYTLGGSGAAIIAVLLWYGVRKRRPPDQLDRRRNRDGSAMSSSVANERRVVVRVARNRVPTLQGWLSCHVYLGISLVVLITLHTGFHWGLNVHTLAYFLMLGVVVSGLYGVYAYLRFPRLMTENLGDTTRDMLLLQIADLDKQVRTLALQLPEEIRNCILRGGRETRSRMHWRERLTKAREDDQSAAAIGELQSLGRTLDQQHSKKYRELYSLMVRKAALSQRAGRDAMLQGKLGFWLYLHVPLAIALMAALVAHILAIFFYW